MIPSIGVTDIWICSFTISLYLILFFLFVGCCYRAQIKVQLQAGVEAVQEKKLKMKPHSYSVETTFDLYQPLS